MHFPIHVMPMNESRQHPNTANAQLVNKPRTRQRAHKAPPALNVPDINDDATERKRVLNVLAQRRYREFSNGSHVPLCPVIKAKSPGEKKRQSRKAASRPAGKAADDTCPANNETLTCEEAAPADTPIETLGVLTRAAFSGFADSNNGLSWNMESLDMSTSPSIMGNSELAVEGSGLDEVSCSRELDDLSVASPPSIQSQSSIGPRAPFNTLSPSELSSDGIDLSFPDSYLLPVTEFALMRAFSRIAARLGCKSNIFDLHAASPFADPSNAVSHLPQTWQPTAAQILIPHHPILDFLPWPSVRERIIYTLTLPEEMVCPPPRVWYFRGSVQKSTVTDHRSNSVPL